MKDRIKDFFNRDRKTLYIMLSIVLISIFSLTIVYAALSVTLNIQGNAQVVASTWDIHLANPKVTSGSTTTTVPSISGNTLSFSTTLKTPGDFYEFTVDVVNGGLIDAMIESVTKTHELTTKQAKYLNYIVEYQNGESINTKQLVTKDSFVRLKVRVEFRKDIIASDLPTTSETLNLEFTVNYVQSDGSGSSVKDNGMKALNVVSGDGTQVGDEVCIKDECFYVISSTEDTVTMLSKYNLYVGGEYDGSNWIAYGDEATGKQDSTMLGTTTDIWASKNGTTSYFSDEYRGINDYDYKGSLVEKYVNDYNNYLISMGVITLDARLITYDEIISLGCNNQSCSTAPSWVYSTSYWTKTPQYIGVYYVRSDDYYALTEPNTNNLFGVRPVIVISKEDF